MRLLALLPALLLVGCDTPKTNPSKENNIHVFHLSIDGCQYLILNWSAVHKGNCHNPLHSKHTPAAPAIVPEVIPPEMQVEAIEVMAHKPII
jgi:hypothetical protein